MADSSYIRKIAEQIRARFKPSELPDRGLDELFDMYAVLALSKGTIVTSEDVHDAWSAWATKYDSDSKSLVPFDKLPKDVQAEDDRFAVAIREIARSL